MSFNKLADGTTFHVQPMLAYPDGLVVAAQLTAIALPVIATLPQPLLDAAKAAVSGEEVDGVDGKKAVMGTLLALAKKDGADDILAPILKSLATAIVHLGDRDRFEAIARPLLACINVEHGDKMLELNTEDKIRTVTGTDIRRLVGLLAASLGANFASFFPGSGATSGAQADAKAG